MQFEMTRTDRAPDAHALATALHHAQEACRLDPEYGEAWATLGFVLERTGRHADALAASRRAVALEPDNWRHHLRLSYASWGEERLREARRTLALLPGFPLAHWLAATVYVARQALPEAERELAAGIAAQVGEDSGQPRFSGVALHWLLGLIHLKQGDEGRALEEFELELSHESGGHLYARECCANTWYAIGALKLGQGRRAEAATAFQEAIERLPLHQMARVGLAVLSSAAGANKSSPAGPMTESPHSASFGVEIAFARAAHLVLTAGPSARAEAAGLIDEALANAGEGSAGWLLPIEPLLGVRADPAPWASALARVRNRAA
jgi:tetratricopeptide (TPR) repeat protein